MWKSYSPLPILTAVPCYGLCNRLRGISSGQILARWTGYGFNVFWGTDIVMPANFSDLFENPGLVFLSKLPETLDLLSTNPGSDSPWLQLRSPRSGCIDVGVEGTAELVLVPPEPFKFETYLNVKPPGMADKEFMRQKRAFLTSLRPLPHIQADIDRVTSAFGPRMVGVHVRTTDTDFFWKHGKYPSPHVYFMQMDRCLEEHADAMFFIASETDETLDAAVERYGNRIIWSGRMAQRPLGDRETVQGQADAVVDLFCLARTSKLIGTHRSSFSYEAAALGDIPLIEIAGRKRHHWEVLGSRVIFESDV